MASLKKQRFGIKYIWDIAGFAKFGQFVLPTKKNTIIQITKLPDLLADFPAVFFFYLVMKHKT